MKTLVQTAVVALAAVAGTASLPSLPADQVTEDAVKSQEVGQGTGLSFEDLRVDSTGKVAVGIETIEGPVLISASRMDNCSGG